MSESPLVTRLDARTVNWTGFLVLVPGLLALLSSFFHYYYTVHVSADVEPFVEATNAWHGFFGWAAAVFALVGSVLMVPEVFLSGSRLPRARLGAFGCYFIALTFIVIAGVVWPGVTFADERYWVHSVPFTVGRDVGYWFSVIAIVVGALVALVRLMPVERLDKIAERLTFSVDSLDWS
jgi:hypothetical protein